MSDGPEAVIAAAEYLLDFQVPEAMRAEVAEAIGGLRQHIAVLLNEGE